MSLLPMVTESHVNNDSSCDPYSDGSNQQLMLSFEDNAVATDVKDNIQNMTESGALDNSKYRDASIDSVNVLTNLDGLSEDCYKITEPEIANSILNEESNNPVIETNIDLLHYNAASRIQTLYYLRQTYYKVKLRKIEQIQEKEDQLNDYHDKYLMDLMVARIQKNVRRWITNRQYKKRILKRKTHMLSFTNHQLDYYATIIQAWYRGKRMRHQYFEALLPTLLQHRYRRSICKSCQKKAIVKRCLLCRSDYCVACFLAVHKQTKGTHHDWLYSAAFIRKKHAEMRAAMSQTTHTDAHPLPQQQGPEYISGDNWVGENHDIHAAVDTINLSNMIIETYTRKYHMNAIHRDGSRRRDNNSSSSRVDRYNDDEIDDDSMNDNYAYDSISSISHSVANNNSSISSSSSSAYKVKKSSRRVQFNHNNNDDDDDDDDDDDEKVTKHSMPNDFSKPHPQQQQQHKSSFISGSDQHHVDIHNDDNNNNINNNDDDEDIIDELLTTSPFDSFITYPLTVTHPHSQKNTNSNPIREISTNAQILTPLYAVDHKGRSIEKNPQFNEYMDFINLIHGKNNNSNNNTNKNNNSSNNNDNNNSINNSNNNNNSINNNNNNNNSNNGNNNNNSINNNNNNNNSNNIATNNNISNISSNNTYSNNATTTTNNNNNNSESAIAYNRNSNDMITPTTTSNVTTTSTSPVTQSSILPSKPKTSTVNNNNSKSLLTSKSRDSNMNTTTTSSHIHNQQTNKLNDKKRLSTLSSSSSSVEVTKASISGHMKTAAKNKMSVPATSTSSTANRSSATTITNTTTTTNNINNNLPVSGAVGDNAVNSDSNNSDTAIDCWKEYVDTVSGYSYWYNHVTQTSSWMKPS